MLIKSLPQIESIRMRSNGTEDGYSTDKCQIDRLAIESATKLRRLGMSLFAESLQGHELRWVMMAPNLIEALFYRDGFKIMTNESRARVRYLTEQIKHRSALLWRRFEGTFYEELYHVQFTRLKKKGPGAVSNVYF
ncbi:hypothetical protein TWF481_002769 [Arthrobotrys musiformis]|uniref:Uncharacterized protein n=1 Tax=Arthrobotrys musiformis TaxID=47236 RepID=A0AAV9VSD8_9PEZI